MPADLNRATELTPEVRETVADLFLYHPWNKEQEEAGRRVRDALAQAVLALIANVPPCPTRTVAVRKIVEARMDCNAAITHGGRY